MRISRMSSIVLAGAFIVTPGCMPKERGKSNENDEVSLEEALLVTGRPHAETGKRTKAYWQKCSAVNRRYIAEKKDLWFAKLRPKAVGSTCRMAAEELRNLDKSGVDGKVIDHVNRVIRGFEQIGAIAETKGEESLLRDADSILRFIVEMALLRSDPAKAVADGGSIVVALGLSKPGAQSTKEAQKKALEVADDLFESEDHVIRHVRESYGIELDPW